MDKIDGPYYFFKLIQRMRSMLPPWMPTIGIEGGRINIVPVDFVVDAIDHIAHKKDLDGKAFHLVDPTPMRVGDVLNIFAQAAHAPQMSLRVNAALLGFIPNGVKKSLMALTPVRRIRNAVMKDLGAAGRHPQLRQLPDPLRLPRDDRGAEGHEDRSAAARRLRVRLWDYWERHLDPDLFIDRTLKGQVQGKVVLITGGSSGIGLAAAHKIAEAGADHGAARATRKNSPTRRVEEALGENENHGKVVTHSADLANNEGVDCAATWLVETYGGVDVLVNNAGRSIRRGIEIELRPLPRLRAHACRSTTSARCA